MKKFLTSVGRESRQRKYQVMREKPEVGRLCLSRAGHDAGEYFVVTKLTEDGLYAYIADGRIRKIDKPKKKKLRHLRMTPIVLEEAAQRLGSAKNALADGELYNMIQRTGRGRKKDAKDAKED